MGKMGPNQICFDGQIQILNLKQMADGELVIFDHPDKLLDELSQLSNPYTESISKNFPILCRKLLAQRCR